MKLWRILWRGRFMGTTRAETAEQARERYSEWSSVPEHELTAEPQR